MIKAFFGSKKWFWCAYGGGVFILMLLAGQVYMSTLFNEIYGEYGDLLQNAIQLKSAGLEKFWALNRYYFLLVMIYMFVFSIANLVGRLYVLCWREAMTRYYIPLLRNVPARIEGESQRIQEDAMNFADIVESLGLRAARSFMLLIFFLPILWDLSKKVRHIGVINSVVANAPLSFLAALAVGAILFVATVYLAFKRDWFFRRKESVSLPLKARLVKWLMLFACMVVVYSLSVIVLQPLVWLALLTSIGGTVISWFVGIKLPGLEYNNQKTEAALRKELVLAEDDRSRLTSPDIIFVLFKEVKQNYRKLYLHYAYFDLWSSWFDMTLAFLPSILLAPSLFGGAITLGILNQVENVFMKVNGSFSFLMENWIRITKLRSIWKRLHEFEKNLDRHQPIADFS